MRQRSFSPAVPQNNGSRFQPGIQPWPGVGVPSLWGGVGWGGEAAWAQWASVLPRWARTLCGPETCWSARWSSLSGGGRANPSSNLFQLRDFEYLKF